MGNVVVSCDFSLAILSPYYCTISIDSSAPVMRDMADQIFGLSSAAVMHYTGEIFVFVDFIIGQDSGIVAYGEASV